jgi:hypothetical protein
VYPRSPANVDSCNPPPLYDVWRSCRNGRWDAGYYRPSE